MADIKSIQNRINSVKDTRKITNAMYLISSTKLRKARKSLDETSPFFRKLRQEIGNIIDMGLADQSRYILSDEEKANGELKGRCGILVITADKGLAGPYNQHVIDQTLALMQEHQDHELFVVGEYGRHYFTSHNIKINPDFVYSDMDPTLYDARMIAGAVMDRFDRGELCAIYCVYTHFQTAISSEAVCIQMMPFEKDYFAQYSTDTKTEEFEYIPSALDVLEHCIPVYCIGMIYSMLVYSFCCEQNDRMMAMDSDNKNADKLLDELTLRYNHLRQDSITQEIIEVSSSMKAGH